MKNLKLSFIILLGVILGSITSISAQKNTEFASKKSTQFISENVTIYRDADPLKFGIAENRIPLAIDIYQFGKGRTLWLNGIDGFLTAVTANKKLKANLDFLLSKNRSISIDGKDLMIVKNTPHGQPFISPMYVYKEKERGIYIGFMLEKAPQEMIDIITKVYADDPIVAQMVSQYYRDHYVIRILQADNVYSKSDPPTLLDAMFAATLIGDKDQELYGVHDGNNYLADIVQFYTEKVDYDILQDKFNPTFETGQS